MAELPYFGRPEKLGDFLAGLFTLAREVVQRRPEIISALDDLINGFDRAQFLRSLPGLRLAFSRFTPREKAHLAERLVEAKSLIERTSMELDVPAEVAAQMMAFEAQLMNALERYGVRK